MSSSSALVLLGSKIAHVAVCQQTTWIWSEVSLDASTSVEATARHTADALRAAGFTGGGLLLGVPASRCLVAAFDSADLPTGDYQTRLFRFEQQLPLSAEQIAAEFVDGDLTRVPQRTLGIAVERAWLEPQVAALEAVGLAVDAIVPTTLLALDIESLTANPAALLAEPGDLHWQLILSESGRPIHWIQLPGDAHSLKRAIQTLSLRGLKADTIRCISTSFTADALPNLNRIDEPRSFQALAAEHAGQVLQGRSIAINFRNNGLPAPDRLRLNRRALDAMLAAVGVMLVLISLSLWIRASRYRGSSNRDQQLMMTHFHETLPGWPTPSNFRAVVASERRRSLPAASGSLAEPTALAMMLRVLPPLPLSSEVTLNELSFAAQHFDLSGTLARYESAQPLSDSARASGLEIAPVQAHRIADNSWQFTLSGQTHSLTKAAQP